MLGFKKWFGITRMDIQKPSWGMHDLQENQNFRMDSVFRHCGGRVAAISNSNRFYPATHRIRNNQHTFLGPSLCVQQNRTCREPPARRQCSRHSPNFWCFAIRFAFQMQVLAYHAGFACFHVSILENFQLLTLSDLQRIPVVIQRKLLQKDMKIWRANWAFCSCFRAWVQADGFIHGICMTMLAFRCNAVTFSRINTLLTPAAKRAKKCQKSASWNWMNLGSTWPSWIEVNF